MKKLGNKKAFSIPFEWIYEDCSKFKVNLNSFVNQLKSKKREITVLVG